MLTHLGFGVSCFLFHESSGKRQDPRTHTKQHEIKFGGIGCMLIHVISWIDYSRQAEDHTTRPF